MKRNTAKKRPNIIIHVLNGAVTSDLLQLLGLLLDLLLQRGHGAAVLLQRAEPLRPLLRRQLRLLQGGRGAAVIPCEDLQSCCG